MAIGAKIVRGLHKTLDPLSMFAYGTSTYEYLGMHSVPHAALAAGVGAALTTVARVAEYYLNRKPVDKVANVTGRIDSNTAREPAGKQQAMKELAKLEKEAKKLAKKSGEPITYLDDKIKALKARLAMETAPVTEASPASIPTQSTVGVSTQPAPAQPVEPQPAPVKPVGERHRL